MLDRAGITDRICRTGVVAIVRADSSEQLIDVVKAVADGGVDCIEITMTTPNALGVIEQSARHFGTQVLIGVGSVLDATTARLAALAGAQYVVSPILSLEVIETTHRYGLASVPGAFTPTEILAAASAGADLVKVFPATKLGPGYFKDILAPMPHLRLTPTGGVNLDTAAEFIKAGAVSLGVGSALVSKKAVAEKDYAGLTATAERFVRVVAEARGR